MSEENITPETLPEEGGEGAVIEEVQTPEAEAMTLGEINELLGKEFKDLETAKKSIKDTQSFVGKKANDVAEDLKDKGYMSEAEFENKMFFRDNPEHADNQALLEAIAVKEGVSLVEASKNDAYTKLFDGAKNYEESQSLKSVLNPNPRLQEATEKSTQVKDLADAGNAEAAANLAAKIVADAYEM